VTLPESFENKPHFLAVINQISEISLRHSDINDALKNILDAVLDIFDCERAFFYYPSRQQTGRWHVPMERTRPSWPSSFNPNTSHPENAELRAYLQQINNPSGKTCAAGAENEIRIPPVVITLLGIQSEMRCAIFPRGSHTWNFAIQHCQIAHTYGDYERHLFEAIGHRIADALSSLIMLRNLRSSEEKQRLLFEHAPNAIFILDAQNGKITDVNQHAQELIAQPRSTLVGQYFDTLFVHQAASADKLANALVKIFPPQKNAGKKSVVECDIRHATGHAISCEIHLVYLPLGEQTLIYASIIDIQERRSAASQQKLLSNALEKTADSVIITDDDGKIIFVNKAFEHTTGYNKKEAIGQYPSIIKSEKQDEKYYRRMWATISSGVVFNDIIVNRRKDGSLYSEEKTITPLYDEEHRITHYISTGKDITERIETQERLNFLAHHDALTKLPNRTLFTDRLDQALKRAERNRMSVAVFFIDLDHFKNINDSSGHDTGDTVLITAAQRFIRCVRKGDTVARLAGDEFAILLEDITDENVVPRIADNIIENFSAPIEVGINQFYVTPSIGISMSPNDGDDGRGLLKNADLAMYRAKEQGRNNYQFYAMEMRQKALNRHLMESNLRHALDRNELFLLYQPQISPDSGNIVAAEALLRWKHPGMGLVLPIDFIPVLEETGMIVRIGEWIIHQVCQQLSEWRDQGMRKIRIAVNISARQFDHGDLLKVVKEALAKYHIPAEQLELEVTESVLMRNEIRARETLEEIENLGVSLALDDFGTGFSSLIYLKRFPIHTIKIDRSFVMDIGHDKDDEAIVRGVVGMAKSLGLDVVAEGVEQPQQIEFLRQLRCEMLQGFAISEPVNAQRLQQLVQAGIHTL